MGEVDVVVLDDIRKLTKKLDLENNWGFKFKIDLGTWETGIEFTAIGYFHPPKSMSWEEVKEKGHELKCPDLLDYDNKIILEYEEEPTAGKKMGKMGKKGHTEESEKDTHRDQLYRIGGFRLFKVWQSEYKKLKSNGSYEWESEKKQKDFEKKLWKFLCDCFCKRKIK